MSKTPDDRSGPPESGGEPSQRPDGRNVMAAEPMEMHAYHERAVQALHRGEFEKAMRYFTRVLELDRGYLPAWLGHVQMLIELGDLHGAIRWAEKALGLFQNQGDLLSAKAVARARLHDRGGAMSCSDAALTARDSSAYRWLARGEVLLECGDAEAEACFERATLEPDADWFTRLWTARICRLYGRRTSALGAARAATEQAPGEPFAWTIRGLCERDLAMGACRISFERALEIDSGFQPVRTALRRGAGTPWLVRWYHRIRGD